MDVLTMISDRRMERLQERFGNRFKPNAPLAKFTAAQIGGRADGLLIVDSIASLIDSATYLWEQGMPFFILGGGSNILVSDAGVRGVVVLNRARRIRFDDQADPPTVRAESGARFGLVARQAASRGLAGLEWAAGIPGTIGGAVVGNAGAHGSDIASILLLADILHLQAPKGIGETERTSGMLVRRENWSVKDLNYGYRSSVLKTESLLGGAAGSSFSNLSSPDSIILGAVLRLERSSPEAVQAKTDEYTSYRRLTQPPGASMGSMFKNPPGDYAGRLIEMAGLKGKKIGGAGISPLHGNFFVNYGNASASDVWQLICLAQEAVLEKFGVALELEIQLVGEWVAGISG
jgi:UDP-N-acetylmuramate dehydrogenase